MRTETRVLVKRGDSFAACDTIFRLLLYTRPSDRRTTALMPRNQLLFQDMLMNLISFKRVLLLRPILFICFVQQMMSGKLLCIFKPTQWYHFVVVIKRKIWTLSLHWYSTVCMEYGDATDFRRFCIFVVCESVTTFLC